MILIDKIAAILNCSIEEAYKILEDQQYYAGPNRVVSDFQDLGTNSLGHRQFKFTISNKETI